VDNSTATESEHQNREAARGKKLLRRMVLLIFLINGAIIFKAFVPEEPAYQGKTITRWLRRGALDRLKSTQLPPEQALNPEVVNGFGPEAWPYLVKAIKQKDSAFSRRCAALWPKLPLGLQNRLSDWRPIPPDLINYLAFEWLNQLGPDAKDAIPDLVEMALHEKNPGFRAAAISALGNIGSESPEALAALIKIIKEPETNVWPSGYLHTMACFAVARFGPMAKPAVPLLVESVRSRKGGAATNVISALGRIGPDAKEAVPVLVEALANPLLRESALISLAAIGPTAEQVVPTVIEILKEPPVNMKALELLFRIGPPAKAALPVLYDIESRATNLLRAYAGMVISKIESANSRRALPALAEALRRKPSKRGPEWTFEFRSIWPDSQASCQISGFPPAMVWFVELDPTNASALPLLYEYLNSEIPIPPAKDLCRIRPMHRSGPREGGN
jgi:HEAT repeat protein